MSEIEKIIPPKIPKGLAISQGKKWAKFKRECAGVNEELIGPDEKIHRENEICDFCSTNEYPIVESVVHPVYGFYDDNLNKIGFHQKGFLKANKCRKCFEDYKKI